VASAVGGLPVPLVQAAAAVRDGGLSFSEIRDLLDDPPRPGALTLALHHALDDHLHVTLSTLRALGDVPAPTPVLAAAAGVTPDEVLHSMRRLAMLGLATTDGRDGWSAAGGITEVSESLRADTAHRLAGWVAESAAPEVLGTATVPGGFGTATVPDVFGTASLLAVVGDRVQARDQANAGALAAACLAHLPLEGLDTTTVLLEQTVAWAGAGLAAAPGHAPRAGHETTPADVAAAAAADRRCTGPRPRRARRHRTAGAARAASRSPARPARSRPVRARLVVGGRCVPGRLAAPGGGGRGRSRRAGRGARGGADAAAQHP
jgi:hypothetical protein